MSAPYMPLYIADYLADTTHLTRSEHGAYLLLLMAMWRAGGKLPADDAKLARLAKCNGEEWSDVKPVVMDFFKRRGGTLTHKRLSEEYAKYENTIRRKSEGGKASAAKKANVNNQKQPNIVADDRQDIATNQNHNQNHIIEDDDVRARTSQIVLIGGWPLPADTAQHLAKAAGLPSAQWQLLTASELLAWRRNGFDYSLDVVPTVTAVACKVKKPPGSWAYFTAAIAQHHANRLKDIDIPEAQPHEPDRKPYKTAAERGQDSTIAAFGRVFASAPDGEAEPGDAVFPARQAFS